MIFRCGWLPWKAEPTGIVFVPDRGSPPFLDVGCGAGVTPCFIAKNYYRRVAGIETWELMIAHSKDCVDNEGAKLTRFTWN